MARALPTTKAQVSGHKFLLRRLEHGLVFGDIRMIHDPLKRRRRGRRFWRKFVAATRNCDRRSSRFSLTPRWPACSISSGTRALVLSDTQRGRGSGHRPRAALRQCV